MGALKNIFVFVIQLAFDFYLYILILRLLMQKFSTNWSNPVTQLVVKFTEPVLKPVRRFVPGFKGFDLAIVVIALIIAMIAQLLVLSLSYGFVPGFLGLILLGTTSILSKTLNCFMFAIIVSALISWFPRLQGGPLSDVVNSLAEPFLRFPRRYIPLLGGFDISPVIVLLVLYWLSSLIIPSLMAAAIRLSL